MRILWLKSDLLLPLDKGGRLRTWHLMRHLAKRHDITYMSFAGNGQEREIEGMREVAKDVVTVKRSDPAKRSVLFYMDAARYLADPLPYAIAKYRSAAYKSALAALLRERPFDVIVCDFLVPAVNLPKTLPCPAVIFTHNVEAEIWRRHADTKSSVPSRWLYRLQHKRMLRFEDETLQRFDGMLAVSDADRDTIARLYPDAAKKPAWVVRTGVDTEYFQPNAEREPLNTEPVNLEPRLVFTGSMDWLPNEDAMKYFCADILPLIRAQVPGVRLSIVGRAPTPAVRALAGDHIEVTGTVDDVRPYMHKAAVYVVPLRIGGGTRLKIFEAMAMGKAVVSTTVGAEGLPVTDGTDAVIADDPQAFAAAVVRLLRDDSQRRAIETAARDLVVRHYDWSAVAGELDEALRVTAALAGGPEGLRDKSKSRKTRHTNENLNLRTRLHRQRDGSGVRVRRA
ncbi:MAG TPA: glycosyltransferase [Vicinamibacterales bacterium]|nr:glycosyltransferase [Vicinamibacterales bacterium]